MTARRAIVVDATVQGVGLRPFVYGLASRFGLTGFMRNRTGNMLIDIEGRSDLLDAFVAAHPGVVTLRSLVGGERAVTMLAGEDLPRIC